MLSLYCRYGWKDEAKILFLRLVRTKTLLLVPLRLFVLAKMSLRERPHMIRGKACTWYSVFSSSSAKIGVLKIGIWRLQTQTNKHRQKRIVKNKPNHNGDQRKYGEAKNCGKQRKGNAMGDGGGTGGWDTAVWRHGDEGLSLREGKKVCKLTAGQGGEQIIDLIAGSRLLG